MKVEERGDEDEGFVVDDFGDGGGDGGCWRSVGRRRRNRMRKLLTVLDKIAPYIF